jgi:hypothetical protein
MTKGRCVLKACISKLFPGNRKALSGALCGAAFLGLTTSLVTPASAQAIAATLEKFGMLGTWAASCDSSPSGGNIFTTYYSISNGQARRRLHLGGTLPDRDGAVDEAEILTATTLRLRLRNDDPAWGDANGKVITIVLEKSGERRRTVSSVDASGTQFIRDGIVLGNGKPSVLQERCNIFR